MALDRTVALKVLAPELAVATRAAERFKREARMVADLEHPNIVPVFRVGQLGGVVFIAMKYVEGRAIDQIIASQGALPVPVIIHVLRSTTRALAHAHERGIVHRDIKGGNILVDRDGRVLVSDFGVALRSSDFTLTHDGTVIGTPAFMSPEQCTGKRAGPQSDQYSLGVVAFQMLTGAVPYESETIAGYIHHHLNTPPPDVALARDDVPPALLEVVGRVLDKDPARRFESTREMLTVIEAVPFSDAERHASEEQLRLLAYGSEVPRVVTRPVTPISEARTLPIAPPPVAPPPPRRRSPLWLGLGAAAALAGAGLLAMRAGTAGTADPPPVLAPPVTTSQGSPVAPEAAGFGTLRVASRPADARILVDGAALGQGAVIDRRISAGRHRIRISAAGYTPFDTSLMVRVGDAINLGRVTLLPLGSSR